jgi:hypothetical protein
MDIVARGSYFRDENGEAFWVPEPHEANPAPEPVAVRQAKTRLVRESLLRLEKHPGRDLRPAMEVMAALALDAEQIERPNRFAIVGDKVFLDLARPGGQVVEITPQGWAMRPSAAVRFRQYQHQRSLPLPTRGGSAWDLLQFLPKLSPASELLTVTWAALVPHTGFPRPVLSVQGPPGSGKSTFAGRVKSVLDPSHVPLLGEDARADLSQACHQHGLPVFDNLTALSPRESDLFCRTVTGGGVSRRRLYTDAGEHFYRFRRPILMTGITMPSRRHDLHDRTIVIPVERLASHRPERPADGAFAAAIPALLGGVLDLLSRAMAVLPSVAPATGFRMADFAHWGRAVAVALGRGADEFDDAYRAAIRHQADEANEDDPLATLVLKYMADREVVPDISREKLFAALQSHECADTRGVNWKDVSGVCGRLDAMDLEFQGVRVTKLPREGRRRSHWRLERLEKYRAATD